MLSTSGLTSYFCFPLAALPIASSIVNVLEHSFKLSNRLVEYRATIKFYQQILDLLEAKKLTIEDFTLGKMNI